MNIESLLMEMDPVLESEIPEPSVLDARRMADAESVQIEGGQAADGFVGRRLPTSAGRPSPRVIVTVLGAAALVLAATVLSLEIENPSTSPNHAGSVPSISAGSWSLAGYITAAGWQSSTSLGPLPTTQQFTTQLTCPTTLTCYSDGTYDPSLQQNSRAVISVTHDGGATWQVSLQPDNQTYFFGFTCVSANTCMVAGQVPNDNTSSSMYVTTDGGQSWTSRKIPGVNDSPVLLSCSTSSSCVALYDQQGPMAADPESVAGFVTANGGATWTAAKLPASFLVTDSSEGLQCFTDGRCIATGYLQVGKSGEGKASAIYSTNDGSTWATASVPSLGAIFGIMSCSSQMRCTSIESANKGGGFLTTSGVLMTSDGGQAWTSLPPRTLMPTGLSGIPSLNSISCPEDSQCWATGSVNGSTCQGSCPYVPETAFIMETNDGAQTWSSEALPTPPSTSLQYVAAYPVSCVTGAECFVVGTLGSTQASSNAGNPLVQQDVVLTNRGNS